MLLTGRDDRQEELARFHYSKAVKLDGDNYSAWMQLASLDWNLKQYDSMAMHLEMATEYFPNQASLYLQQGVAYTQLEQYAEGIRALEKAKMLSTGNPAMIAQANSYLADLYHKKKDYAKSDEAYEAVLAYNANDLYALNNYSYYLSLRKEKLDLARKMSSRLVTLSPESDTYLDTYGWVLYISGEFEQAKKYLEMAAQRTKSGTVVEHYGDVLFKLGEKENAIQQWKRAKSLGGSENPALLERKLQEGRLID
jgi:tetratricopeptide (TPR) repeat protein